MSIKKQPNEDWHYCHDCHIKRGAKLPKGGLLGCTVMLGKCPGCKKLKKTLIPNSDYDYPGRKAIWD